MIRPIIVLLILIIVALSMTRADAASKKPKSAPAESDYQTRVNEDTEALYEEGKALADQEDYKAALEVFEGAARKYPNDPEILNMLAYCQRKTGNLEEAIANYHKALELKPDFPEAREYLGEAYIQAALKEIETLKGYGPSAQEQLAYVVEEFKEAAGGL